MTRRKIALCGAVPALAVAVLALLLVSLGAGSVTGADEAATAGVITGEVSAKPAKARAGVVVSLEKVPGTFRAPAKPMAMDQKGMMFIPHVLPVLRGTTVRFLNNDMVRHNVFSPDGEKYDLGTWPKGESKDYTFAKTGVYRQLCRIHPEMLAFIVVLDNPYFAVTGDDGRFRIEGVPPGTYTLRAWGEKLSAATTSVTVAAGGTATVGLEMKK